MPRDPKRINNVDTPGLVAVSFDPHLYLRRARMKIIVKKWGNSAAIRIPAAILEAAHVELDQHVDVREERGRIVIVPIRHKEYDLADLVAGITRENRHDATEFGPPLGREAW